MFNVRAVKRYQIRVEKLKVFLRYVVDPGYQNSVGEITRIHQNEVMENIWQKSNLWIKFPFSNEEIREALHLWQQVCSFPAAAGVLDCTHVRIRKHYQFRNVYINPKGYRNPNILQETR